MQISCPHCKAAFKLQPEVLRANNTRAFACPKCQKDVPVPDHVFEDEPFDKTMPPDALPPQPTPIPQPPAPVAPPAPPVPPAPPAPETDPPSDPPTKPAPTSPFLPNPEASGPHPTANQAPLPPANGTVVGMQQISLEIEPVTEGWTFSMVCMSGPCNGEKRGLDKTPYVIGREQGQWVTEDPHMSKEHFHILIRGPEIQIMDLGSTNGTAINGAKIAGAAPLANRDEIQAGSSTFLFVAVEKSDLEDEGVPEGMEMEAPVPEGGDEEATSLAGPSPLVSGTIPNVPESFRVFLEILEGPDQGKTVDLSGKQTLVVGRGKDADLMLSDQTCSRKHCQVIIKAMGDYALRDLASTNGTYLNGQRIMQEKLKNLDTFRLGRTTIRFNALKAAW